MSSSPEPELRTTTLANGIRIVTERMPLAHSVTSGIWVRVGARDEPDELAGASHFLEHLLFKGTDARTARSIAEDVDAVGGEMNAHTSREYTAFYTRLPASAWQLGIDILGDILSAPAFREHELEAERQVILEEILISLDTPDDVVHTRLAEALFPGHPLGREVLGSTETVEAMSRADVRRFFEHWYRPANLIVAAAGDLDHDAFVARTEAALGEGADGVRPVRLAPDRPLEPLAFEHRPNEQVHLALGWRGLSATDDDRYALAVANQILGGGMASRLFQEIREERGLAYTVYSYAAGYVDGGAVTVYAGTGPKRVAELLAVLDAELERFVAEDVTEQELEVAKGYLEGSTVLGLEDSGGRMTRLGRGLIADDELRTVEEQLARVRAVDVADVRAVARRVFGADRALAVVGPADEALFSR